MTAERRVIGYQLSGRTEFRDDKTTDHGQQDHCGKQHRARSMELGGGKVTWLQDHRTIDYGPLPNQKGVALLQSKLLANRARKSVFDLCVPRDGHRPAIYRICISIAPAMFDRYPRGFTGHAAHPGRSIVC
jgi:hypothetical protein